VPVTRSLLQDCEKPVNGPSLTSENNIEIDLKEL